MQVRYEMPMEMRDQYLANHQIMEKARPFLEKKAKQALGEEEDEADDD